MKINEVLTSKAKIMEAGLSGKLNAIVKAYVKNNSSIPPVAKKQAEKDLRNELKAMKPEEREATLRKYADASGNTAPSTPEPSTPSQEISSEELKGELKNAQSQLSHATSQINDLRARKTIKGAPWNQANLHQRIAKARVDAISKVLDGKNAYTTDDVKQLRNVLRAQKMWGKGDLSAKKSLHQIYNGLPNQDEIVSNLMSKVWPNIKNASGSKNEIDRDAYGTGDEQELGTANVTHQGTMTLDQLEARGIEIDDNQKRAIQSGRIASEVRIVEDNGNKGLLETPLGLMEGEISPIKIKFGLDGDAVGTYAQCVILVQEPATNDSYGGRGTYTGVRDVAPLNRKKNVSVKFGNKQIIDVDDAHSVSMVKPLRLKGTISKDRPYPEAVIDRNMDKKYPKQNNKSGSDYYSDFKKEFGY